ncbi:hypothetical protein FOXB_08273 [Fusarium oxysporum f. sp. conglutinans Fo5176]|uniref:Uncharacterized protein n=1 Tax=Fusarium oxysporum (strain Fo5176) TaxID=660025 RepID=F9FPE3_FUSOF|nr:hypothetical protein FOXB_08273 [Fusarium oxysporum f. sp. conglutinans Fo5176]
MLYSLEIDGFLSHVLL